MKKIYFFIIVLLLSCKSNKDPDLTNLNNNYSKEINLIVNVEEKKDISLTRTILNSRLLNIVSIYLYGVKFKIDKKGNITSILQENISFEDYKLSNIIINTKTINNKNYYIQECDFKYSLKLDKKNYKNSKSFVVNKNGADIIVIFNNMITSCLKKINKKNIQGIIIPYGELSYKEDGSNWTLKEKFVIYY